MSTYVVSLPGSDGAWCVSEAEVREALEAYRVKHPQTAWAGAHIHEMRPGGTAGNKRSVYDFIDDPES